MKKNNSARYSEILKTLNKQTNTQPLTKDDKVLIIDGLNTFIRSFTVSPQTNDNGEHTGGIAGFLLSIGYTIKLLKPTRVIIAFDGKGGSKRRKQIFPDYKSKRAVTFRVNRAYDYQKNDEDVNDSMKRQLSRLLEYLDILPLQTISIDNIEADDTIAYIAKEIIYDKAKKIYIMSSDKDFLQLVDDKIEVWSPTKKKLYTKQDVFDEYGILANNFIIYRTICGDKSDNISGIKGIGLKTLIKNFPILSSENISFDEFMKFVEQNKEKKYYDQIFNNKNILEMNFLLMKLIDLNISGITKMNITRIINEGKPNSYINYKFKVLFIEDRLWNTVNVDTWLYEVWHQINIFTLK